jgi:hypothetical protein
VIATSTLNCIVEEHANRDEWLKLACRASGPAIPPAFSARATKINRCHRLGQQKKSTAEIDPVKLKRFKVAKLLEPAMRSILSDETGWPCESAGEFTILSQHGPSLAVRDARRVD